MIEPNADSVLNQPENMRPPDYEPLDYAPSAFDRVIVHIGNIVSGFYLIAVFITVIEVVMRYVFNAPTQWVYEVSIMLIGSAMLYGGAYCMSNNGHIRVTVITDLLPRSIQRWIHVVIALLTLLFMLSLCYAAVIMLDKAMFTPSGVFRVERSGSAFNSFMPTEIKMTLLFVVLLMALQSVLQFIQAIVRVCQGDRHHA